MAIRWESCTPPRKEIYMNNRDKNNLAFLMQGDTPALRQWYKDATEDDKEYAMELLMRATKRIVQTDEGLRTLH